MGKRPNVRQKLEALGIDCRDHDEAIHNALDQLIALKLSVYSFHQVLSGCSDETEAKRLLAIAGFDETGASRG